MNTYRISQKVVTVNEIGFEENGHYDESCWECIDHMHHFVCYNHDVARRIVSTSIVEIGEFELPVTRIKAVKGRHWWEGSRPEVEIVGRCSGSWLRLSDGRKIYVHETVDDLKRMIEGD